MEFDSIESFRTYMADKQKELENSDRRDSDEPLVDEKELSLKDRFSEYEWKQFEKSKPFWEKMILLRRIRNNWDHLWTGSDAEFGRRGDLESNEVYCKLERIRNLSFNSGDDNLIYEAVSLMVSKYHRKMEKRTMRGHVYDKICESSEDELLEEFRRRADVGLRMDTRNKIA